MAHEKSEAATKLTLPVSVSGPVEVGRLARELGEIEDALLQLGIRSGGEKMKMPQTSRLMDQVVEQNHFNLLHEKDRHALKDFLVAIHHQAPVLHMSFSADPSPAFLEKLVSWLRKEIHEEVLLTVGLQPNLGAGCILRTTNKQFDLSLRQDFAKKRDLLMSGIVGQKAEVTA